MTTRSNEGWIDRSPGGGELRALVARFDWASTSLGPRDVWPPSLRTALEIVLESPIPMALAWGRDLVLLYNDAYVEIAAERHPRALGRAAPEVWPEIWHLLGPILDAVIDRGESVRYEDQLFPVRRDGRIEDAYFTASYTPVRLEDGTVGGTLATLLETTERVRRNRLLELERARAESVAKLERERLAAVLARIPVMVTVYDPTLRSFHLNEAFQRALGWTEDDARTHDLLALCYPDPARRAEMQRFMQAAEPGWREVEVTAKDGSRVASSWANVRLSDETQVGIGIDLRERRRADAALRDSEAQLRALYEQSPAMVVVSDLDDGRIVEINEGFTRMLGFTRAEALGHTPVELGIFSPSDRRQMVEQLREAGRVQHVEVAVRSKSGEALTGLLSSKVIELGGERRLVTVTADITDRKRTEEALREANERLEQADRHKNEFMAVLSHELRNPLAPIRHGVYLLEHSPPGSEQARRAAQVIGRQAEHMARLVDDLLDLTRVSRGKITLQREHVDLCALVRSTAEDHRAQFASAGVSLDVEAPREPCYVDGDPTRLVQVIGNLLNNAAKFTPRGGRTAVSVGAASDRVVVRVRDDGAGMLPHTIERLFEPFAQAPQTLERTRGGLGLGLALVKGLVELHGGEVRAQSAGEGRGSEFVVELPLCARAARAAPEPRPSAPTSRRVLIVEDNVDAADMLRELLELRGHVVALAHDGRAALEAASAQRPEVVLCDLGLPELDGYGVARALRADPELRGSYLVALSGYAQPDDVERSRAAGFDRHVAKPPSLDTLDALLAEVPRA